MSYLDMARRIIAEVSTADEGAATPDPPNGFGRCIGCAAALPWGVELAQCNECRHARGYTAMPAPYSRPPYPLRVVVDGQAPSNATADLAALRNVVEAYGAIWHDDSRLDESTQLGERIEELIQRIERVGCVVRVEAMS